MSSFIKTGLVAFLSAALGVWITLEYLRFDELKEKHAFNRSEGSQLEKQASDFVNAGNELTNILPTEDFVHASELSTNSVGFYKKSKRHQLSDWSLDGLVF